MRDNLFFFVLFSVLPFLLAACAPSTLPSGLDSTGNNSPDEGIVADTSNFNSAVIGYGALLRKSYRGGLNPEEIRALEELEAAAERSGVISVGTAREIEMGMLLVGMPSWQLFASRDNLRLAGTATLEEFAIKEYEGSPVRSIARGRVSLETILTCRNNLGIDEERVIAFTTLGRTTFESRQLLASRSIVQTNFKDSDFNIDSSESQKYVRTGLTPPREPRVITVEAGGWPGLILIPVSSIGGNLVEPTLQEHFENSIASGGHPRLLQHLRRVC